MAVIAAKKRRRRENRRRDKRRRQKTSEQNRASPGGAAKDVFLGQKLNIFSLPQDMVLMIVEFLDVESALSFLRTSKVRL